MGQHREFRGQQQLFQDRKSTRLNSSHLVISYAVFCLKKKKNRDAAAYDAHLPHRPDVVPPRCVVRHGRRLRRPHYGRADPRRAPPDTPRNSPDSRTLGMRAVQSGAACREEHRAGRDGGKRLRAGLASPAARVLTERAPSIITARWASSIRLPVLFFFLNDPAPPETPPLPHPAPLPT